MADPHVETLEYLIETHDEVELALDNATFSFPGFDVTVAGTTATVSLTTHTPYPEAARALVEPQLRRWALDDGLTRGRPIMTFRFTNARVVDRTQHDPSATKNVAEFLVDPLLVDDEATQVTTRRTLPPPPSGALELSRDVETMWQRYEGYARREEPLSSMANFIDTYVRQQFGAGKGNSRTNAARALNLHEDLLREIGRLSVGGEPPRKAGGSPLTDAEIKWLRSAVRLVIRRVAEAAATHASRLTQLGPADVTPA